MAITDDFNRPDAGNLGPNWTPTAYNMGIQSNRAVVLSGTVYNFSYYSGVLWTPTHSSAAEFHGPAGVDMELTVRHQPGGDLYFLMVHSGIPDLRIYSYLSGGFGLLVSFGVAPVDGHIYELSASGTTLRAYDNGVQLGSDVNDSSLSNGAPGIGGSTYLFAGNANWENWVGTGEVGSVVAGQPTTVRHKQTPHSSGGALVTRGGGRIFGRAA